MARYSLLEHRQPQTQRANRQRRQRSHSLPVPCPLDEAPARQGVTSGDARHKASPSQRSDQDPSKHMGLRVIVVRPTPATIFSQKMLGIVDYWLVAAARRMSRPGNDHVFLSRTQPPPKTWPQQRATVEALNAFVNRYRLAPQTLNAHRRGERRLHLNAHQHEPWRYASSCKVVVRGKRRIADG